jgi:hypothetical protein
VRSTASATRSKRFIIKSCGCSGTSGRSFLLKLRGGDRVEVVMPGPDPGIHQKTFCKRGIAGSAGKSTLSAKADYDARQ